jgi:hypothetical protein
MPMEGVCLLIHSAYGSISRRDKRTSDDCSVTSKGQQVCKHFPVVRVQDVSNETEQVKSCT